MNDPLNEWVSPRRVHALPTDQAAALLAAVNRSQPLDRPDEDEHRTARLVADGMSDLDKRITRLERASTNQALINGALTALAMLAALFALGALGIIMWDTPR